jgi:hypothetical protein
MFFTVRMQDDHVDWSLNFVGKIKFRSYRMSAESEEGKAISLAVLS